MRVAIPLLFNARKETVRTGIYLVAVLLARSQYPEGPATGNLDTGFSWFPCVYKQMLTDGSQHSKLPLHSSHVALPT